jgi:hypothetical protein
MPFSLTAEPFPQPANGSKRRPHRESNDDLDDEIPFLIASAHGPRQGAKQYIDPSRL